MSGVLWAVVAFAIFAIGGNIAILIAHLATSRKNPRVNAAWGVGTEHAHEVSDRLWRSGRPSEASYRAVAAAGAKTIIDLRAEGGDGPNPELGLDWIRLPVRDGRPPDPETIRRLRSALDAGEGHVLVHCSAGVGRTGSALAARLVLDEGWDTRRALREVLSVGPPSLEQIDFVLGLPNRLRPHWWAVVLSRALDAPRRTWSRLRARLRLLRTQPE